MRAPERLSKLSLIIPARDEQDGLATTIEHITDELSPHQVPYEIVVVDDGSTDRTWQVLTELESRFALLRAMKNPGPYGFGRALTYGLERMAGDAAVIMMADDSDDCADVVRYWHKLDEGFDCVFGSRFMERGCVTGYPRLKLLLNRLFNRSLVHLFRIPLDDTTNGFKAYRKRVLFGCQPFRSAGFELNVELPLKAILRGYSWTVVPVTWRGRRSGTSKFWLLREGFHYAITAAALWLEHPRSPAVRVPRP